jgi:hypothetical protein
MPEIYDRPGFEIEHIIARQHDGLTVAGNLALACFSCNKRKGPNLTGIDCVTGKVVPLFHPRRHKWSRHFRWQGALLVGRTPIGRATIAAAWEVDCALRSSTLKPKASSPSRSPRSPSAVGGRSWKLASHLA